MGKNHCLVSGPDGRGASFGFEVWNLVREKERQHLIESMERASTTYDGSTEVAQRKGLNKRKWTEEDT
jgi:hypothetical protein